MARSDLQPQDAMRPSPTHAHGSAALRPSLLIADAARDACQIYAQYFGSRGFSVVTAHDGPGAIRTAFSHLPDVVVIDLAMPGFDGVTAMQCIKAHSSTRHTRVILLTGHLGRAIERGALEAGADKLLTKPCPPHELERHVHDLRKRPGSPLARRRGKR